MATSTRIPPVTTRDRPPKKPTPRAFKGLAGSYLAKINRLVEQPSDHILRVPKTPDREEPIPFDVWFDSFGQKHWRIDLDCAFQDCAFDPHLGSGTDPNVDSEKPGRNDGEEGSVLQDLGFRPDQKHICTGLLEGERERRKRRPTDKSWWIFDGKLFREFIESICKPNDYGDAAKAYIVLYSYYYENRQDDDIEYENPLLFDSCKKVKQYRQYIVKRGAERFKDQKPESTWHGRRSVWRGFRCDDPNCDQCKRNEVSEDFSGREDI